MKPDEDQYNYHDMNNNEIPTIKNDHHINSLLGYIINHMFMYFDKEKNSKNVDV